MGGFHMGTDKPLSIPLDLFENIYSSDKHTLERKYEFLGEGASRAVFGIDENFVVKVAKNKTGHYQCHTENYIYSNISDQYKKYLCPVIWYKDNMLFMRRAIPFTKLLNHRRGSIFEYTNIRRDSTFFKNIKKITKRYDLLYPDIKSITSWGTLDDIPVLIDYGCTNKLYDYYFD